MHSGINISYECCVSQSVLYEVLNAVSDDVFKKNVYLMEGNNACVIRIERFDINYCEVQG